MMKKFYRNLGIQNYLLLLLTFSLSISIYITDIIILLLIITWIISGDLKKKFIKIKSEPILYSTLLFLIYLLMNSCLTNGEIWNKTIQKQLLIILLPVLGTLNFKQKYLTKVPRVFIMGIFVNILLSIFTLLFPMNSFFKSGHYEKDFFAHAFIDHFDYSIFLCFGIFLIISLNKEIKNKYIYLGIILILLITLLNSYGRVGILTFFLLIPFILFVFERSRLHNMLLMILFTCSVIMYNYAPPFQNRINNTFKNISLIYNPLSLEEKIELDAMFLENQNDSLKKEHYINEILKNKHWVETIAKKNHGLETSLGKRYVYIKNSLKLIKQKPLFGHGVNYFKKTKKELPHNNFIFILVEVGILGLGFLLFIFFTQIKDFFIYSKKDWLKLIFPIFFLFIMFFDNYILHHNTLVFFCLFSFIIFKKSLFKNISA